ncbi:MAG: sugar transferase [Candidatus Pacebacteria bacterium]|nr:sugar transferase [Candidatus Paceibacterota bacterium]
MIKLRQFILTIGDIVLAFLALLSALNIRYLNNFNSNILNQHLIPFGIIYFVWIIFFYIFGLYDLKIIGPKGELPKRMLQCFSVCLIVALAFFYLIPFFGITPKTNLLLDIGIFATFIFLWRKLFYALFSSVYRANIAFLGKAPLALSLLNEIKSQPQLGYKLIGFLSEKIALSAQIKKYKISVLVISENIEKNSALAGQLYGCLGLKTTFLSLDKAYEEILGKIPIDFVNQAWFLKNLSENEKSTYDKIKRLTDFIIAVVLIIITSPIWLISAIAIKLDDRGPIFYKQERVGKNRKNFLIFKFRSMVVNAEKKGAVWAEKKDPRVTAVGAVLKKFHIDEFPQMLNVLKGELSLTGPRPERPEFVKQLEKEIPHYHLRHIIKPGFTGWAQTRFIQYARSKEESHEKFQYDLYYIKNRSFLLDLGILLKTFLLFFKTE